MECELWSAPQPKRVTHECEKPIITEGRLKIYDVSINMYVYIGTIYMIWYIYKWCSCVFILFIGVDSKNGINRDIFVSAFQIKTFWCGKMPNQQPAFD